jgi:hypothetical protein
MQLKTGLSIRDIGALLWNFLLYLFGFFLGMILGRGDLYACSVVYFFLGGLCYFWTSHIIVGILPAAIAFPVAYATFTSAVISDDTNAQARLSLWSSMRLMDREDVESLILAVIAATIGWLLLRFVLRSRKEWVQKARPYFFSFSACLVLAYFVLMFIYS